MFRYSNPFFYQKAEHRIRPHMQTYDRFFWFNQIKWKNLIKNIKQFLLRWIRFFVGKIFRIEFFKLFFKLKKEFKCIDFYSRVLIERRERRRLSKFYFFVLFSFDHSTFRLGEKSVERDLKNNQIAAGFRLSLVFLSLSLSLCLSLSSIFQLKFLPS